MIGWEIKFVLIVMFVMTNLSLVWCMSLSKRLMALEEEASKRDNGKWFG